jgi:hypothetical protein
MVVGVAGVGPLVCLWLEWRARRRGDWVVGQAARRLARLSIQALWLGMLLGAACLALLALEPGGRFWQALTLIPARRLWFNGAELALYLACMEVYVRRWQRMPALARVGLAFFAGTSVLYHFPLLFSAVSVISGDRELMEAGRTLGWRELVGVFGTPQTLSRVVHAILAACVVTGVALMKIAAGPGRGIGLWPMRGRRMPEQPMTDEAMSSDSFGPSPNHASSAHGQDGHASHAPLAACGARLALAAAMLQIPAGAWILLNLPASLRDQFLAVDAGATLLFASGLVTMIGLLHHLAAAALGDASPAVLRRCVVLVVVLFLCMVGAGHRARAVSAASVPPRARAAVPAVSTAPALPGTPAAPRAAAL